MMIPGAQYSLAHDAMHFSFLAECKMAGPSIPKMKVSWIHFAMMPPSVTAFFRRQLLATFVAAPSQAAIEIVHPNDRFVRSADLGCSYKPVEPDKIRQMTASSPI